MKLDIDWLKSNAKVAHFFGLGFIQIKLDDVRRVHFYHPDIPAFVEDPHDHRYDFISSVLKGRLFNRVWKLADGDDHLVKYESCRQNGPEVPPSFKSGLKFIGNFETRAGSGYHMNSESFHAVCPDFTWGPTITLVEREMPHKEFARVALQAGQTSSCPFSRPIPDAELWDIVERCIKSSDTRNC